MKNYYRKNRKIILAGFCFTLLCFGFMLTTHTVGIDEDTWILESQPSLLWLLQGRFGVYLMNLFLTDNGRYIPFLWDFLAVAAWYASAGVFSFGLFGKREGGTRKLPLFFFLAYYSSLPFVAGEMLNFSNFNFQVSLGMLCCAFAFVLALPAENEKRQKLLPALLLLVLSFSVYQANICLFVTAVVAWCLLGYLEHEQNVWQQAGRCAVLCGGGILLYYSINMLLTRVVGSAGYLSDNYIGWLEESSILKALFLALANIVRVSFGITIQEETIYGGEVICAVSAGFLVWGFLWLLRKQPKGRRAGFAFFCGALMCAPFVLYVILGTYKTHGRVLLALPLAGAVELWLILTFVNSSLWKKLCVAAGAYLLFLNARNMNWLFYEAKLVYDYDKETANQVMYDVLRAGMDYHEKPIVFIGCRTLDKLPIEKAGTIGGSLFAWDDGNNYRMWDFMETQGYVLLPASAEQMEEALQAAEDMPVWPAEGSVKETENTIVVYFSQPTQKWYSVNNVLPENLP